MAALTVVEGTTKFYRIDLAAVPDRVQNMSDVFSKKKRSEVMSKIRARGNKETELAMVSILRTCHITGWRRNLSLFGKPDFAFRQERLIVFVDGCFWHGCPKHANMPRNNRSFWTRKLNANKHRDRVVTRHLKKSGWHVLRIWEHELAAANSVRIRVQTALERAATQKMK